MANDIPAPQETLPENSAWSLLDELHGNLSKAFPQYSDLFRTLRLLGFGFMQGHQAPDVIKQFVVSHPKQSFKFMNNQKRLQKILKNEPTEPVKFEPADWNYLILLSHLLSTIKKAPATLPELLPENLFNPDAINTLPRKKSLAKHITPLLSDMTDIDISNIHHETNAHLYTFVDSEKFNLEDYYPLRRQEFQEKLINNLIFLLDTFQNAQLKKQPDLALVNQTLASALKKQIDDIVAEADQTIVAFETQDAVDDDTTFNALVEKNTALKAKFDATLLKLQRFDSVATYEFPKLQEAQEQTTTKRQENETQRTKRSTYRTTRLGELRTLENDDSPYPSPERSPQPSKTGSQPSLAGSASAANLLSSTGEDDDKNKKKKGLKNKFKKYKNEASDWIDRTFDRKKSDAKPSRGASVDETAVQPTQQPQKPYISRDEIIAAIDFITVYNEIDLAINNLTEPANETALFERLTDLTHNTLFEDANAHRLDLTKKLNDKNKSLQQAKDTLESEKRTTLKDTIQTTLDAYKKERANRFKWKDRFSSKDKEERERFIKQFKPLLTAFQKNGDISPVQNKLRTSAYIGRIFQPTLNRLWLETESFQGIKPVDPSVTIIIPTELMPLHKAIDALDAHKKSLPTDLQPNLEKLKSDLLERLKRFSTGNLTAASVETFKKDFQIHLHSQDDHLGKHTTFQKIAIVLANILIALTTACTALIAKLAWSKYVSQDKRATFFFQKTRTLDAIDKVNEAVKNIEITAPGM